MLTAMKLTGQVSDITAYHCRQENYYYKQGKDLADEMTRVLGTNVRTDEPLSYVRTYGQLCQELGFKDGEGISEDDLVQLLSGCNRQGNKLCQKHKTHAVDMTFSAPKTVSIAGLVMRDFDVVQAHRYAVEETMKFLEEEFAFANLGKGKSEYTGKLIWAQVDDGFSREKDPHLHSHCLVMNLTGKDGKYTSVDWKHIMKPGVYQMLGAIYRAKLAQRLKDFYTITYLKGGEWRLDKISFECEKAFSVRRQQILDAQAQGKTDMEAWRKTRQDKDPDANKDVIRMMWDRTYQQTNTNNAEKNRQMAIEVRTNWAKEAEYSIEAEHERTYNREKLTDKQHWQLAIRRATEQEALATREDLIKEYLYEKMRAGSYYIQPKEIEKNLQQQIDEGLIVKIGDYYTSWEMIKAELDYIQLATREISEMSIHQAGEELNTWNEKSRRKLSDQQRYAAISILKTQEQFVVVQGDAGAGKTTMLKAVADIYKKHGYEVVGVSVQGIAAQKLSQEAGIEAKTLKSYLAGERYQPQEIKPKIVIFDEASMLDSRNAAKLFRKAKQAGDKIILVGDRNQLQSIAAGRVFERLVDIKKEQNKLVELTENYRQRNELLRKAVECARDGYLRESLRLLDTDNRIIEVPDKFVKGENLGIRERYEKIVQEYDKDTLVITSTRQAREEMNILIRNKLKLSGELQKEKTFDLVRTDVEGIDEPVRRQLAIGEQIVFTKNEYNDYDVRNGEKAIIEKFHLLKPDVITVRCEDGRRIDIDTKKYKNIDYGYALTTYKSQGQTYNKVVIDADTRVPNLLDFRNQYVNITRARDDIKIYTNDKEAVEEMSEVLTHKRDTIGKVHTSIYEIIEQEKKIQELFKKKVQERVQIPAAEKTQSLEKTDAPVRTDDTEGYGLTM